MAARWRLSLLDAQTLTQNVLQPERAQR